MSACLPTEDEIAEALARVGIREAPLTTLARDERIAVILASDRIAWFPRSAAGCAMLERERRVLRLLERHCSFAAPRVLYVDQEGWELRTMVPGESRPFDLYERAQRDRALAVRIGEQLGHILADQHANVPAHELGVWLPPLPNWPRVQDLPHLPLVVEDRTLLRRIECALERRETMLQHTETRVLTHSDLGFHNIAFDPSTCDVVGVFDYEGAAFSDRHVDFKNMSLHCVDGSEPLLEAAAKVYAQGTGFAIDRDRVRLLNAVEAIGFLGFRFGHAPEEEWCGRTLAQDLAWADNALRAAGIA